MDDLISRRKAIDAMGKAKWAKERLMELPSVQPDHVADIGKKVEGDCISRQAAVNFFNDWISCLDENCHHQSVADMTIIKNDFKNLPSVQPERVCVATVTLTDEQVKEAVEKAKNAVISVIEPEPHWIPCSERLPERSIEVLTYTALVNLIEIQTLERDEHGFMYWENQHGDRQDLTVTAWKPLPEPYRGGDE